VKSAYQIVFSFPENAQKCPEAVFFRRPNSLATGELHSSFPTVPSFRLAMLGQRPDSCSNGSMIPTSLNSEAETPRNAGRFSRGNQRNYYEISENQQHPLPLDTGTLDDDDYRNRLLGNDLRRASPLIKLLISGSLDVLIREHLLGMGV
jgi:hypothetical protein